MIDPLNIIEMYIGTYTGINAAEGIYHATLDLKTGQLNYRGLACASPNPTFVEIHPTLNILYAVAEQNQGAVSAFSVDSYTKKLKLINESSSTGKGPCHLCISQNGKTLLVANYDSGNVASIPINIDGSLADPISSIQHTGSSLNPQRQQQAHAHSVNLSPDNRFVYVADLGLDKIMIYRLDPDSSRLLQNEPSEISVKPGAGPRHLSFSINGKFAYLINELDETMVVFIHDPKTGNLSSIQTLSTLPEGFIGTNFCAEVKVHPNGRFLYGSNRGHNSIVIYKMDSERGTLDLQGFQDSGIKNPRNFNIDPTGQFCIVANQDSDSVVSFRINQKTGALESTCQKIQISKPVCVRFLAHHSRYSPL